MKVLLVQPNSVRHIGFKYMALTEPLGLETVAACLPQYNPEILDLRLDSDLERRLESLRPAAVGVAVPFTTAVYEALEILQAVKKFNSNIFTFVGGHHATLSPTDFLKGLADAVVVGEGEATVPELLEVFERGGKLSEVRGIAYFENDQTIFTPSRELICNLDSTPLADRNLIRSYQNKYFYKSMKPLTLLETARGCPFRCKFCSVWKFHKGKYRARSSEKVVEEILTIEGDHILFADDNFLQNVRRAENICQEIAKHRLQKRFGFQARTDTIAANPQLIKKWKEIGLEWVLVGFESFQEEELESLNKKNTIKANEQAVHILQENGIQIQAAFIVNPGYEKKEFNMLANYIKKMKLLSPQITILTPLPGTEFFREKWHELTTRNYELFDFLHAVIPTKLPLDQFYKEFCRLYRKVSVENTIKSILRRPFSLTPKNLWQGIKVFNNVLRPKAYLKGHLQRKPVS